MLLGFQLLLAGSAQNAEPYQQDTDKDKPCNGVFIHWCLIVYVYLLYKWFNKRNTLLLLIFVFDSSLYKREKQWMRMKHGTAIFRMELRADVPFQSR